MPKNKESLSEWAADVQRDVFDHWKDNHEGDYDRGVKIFYGPVFKNPKILFLGFQPGGRGFEERHRFEQGDFSPPDEHEYLTESYPLAEAMRNKLFPDHTHLIEDSVALNHIFYRAPDTDAWESVPESQRRDMKDFSINKVSTIIEELDPDNILLFGMMTWDTMKDRIGFETSHSIDRLGNYSDGHKIVKFSQTSSPQYIGLVHPSSQFSPSDREFTKARESILAHVQ